MKIALSGKGGVGKTTLSVCLSRYLAEQGHSIILVDADPDADTALALGLEETPEPLSALKELINERTGASGTGGEYFSLNPKVDDIPDRYSVQVNGVRLLRMGRLAQGGAGCFCPENAFLKNLLAHLFFSEDQYVVLDMEAGIEHLGRGTAQGVDALIVLFEPGRMSLRTALEVKEYAGDIGLTRVGVIANNYSTDEELEAIKGEIGSLPLVGTFPHDDEVSRADLEGRCPYTGSETQKEHLRDIVSGIERFLAGELEESAKN